MDQGASPVLELADRLHSASIHLLRRVRKNDVRTGEGPARLSALSVLVFSGPKTLGELARAEQVTAPTMSRIVGGMLQNRLVKVVRDLADARRKRIHPTTKGTRLMFDARRARVDAVALNLRTCPPEERAQLEEGVRILMKVLDRWV